MNFHHRDTEAQRREFIGKNGFGKSFPCLGVPAVASAQAGAAVVDFLLILWNGFKSLPLHRSR